MATHMSATPLPATNGETHARGPQATTSTGSTATSAPSVNRKKQKRRQKQAARLAAEHPNAYASGDADMLATDEQRSCDEDHEYHLQDHSHTASGASYGYASPEHRRGPPTMNGSEDHHAASGEAPKRKKNRKARSDSQNHADRSSTPLSTPSATFSHPPPPPQSMPYISRFTGKPMKNSSIWNQSTLEERENIRTFWFELGEEERRQLVKVEKDAVLKKMKEQQKHSCSCTVCGRKRTAIEEELEVLYDAYYEELEQYANNNQGAFDEGAPIIPPRLYQPPLRSPGHHTRTHGQFHPSRSRVQELPEDNDDDLEEDYDEEEEEDDEEEDEDEEEEDDEELYSDEDLEDDEARAARADFFAFGNSLTVKDGILTVADDLLKNDGKHFIDMMEQLAERRMQREEDTQYGIAAAHQSFHGHNHGPLDDEDYDDEEDDEDYDSQEEEEFDEDEMDAMTEEQRMQEGRRMFQIFAARMFEQRVMTAYREKVAEQRQKQLIDELLQEETLNEQRNAKKAREAQKKKDKKRLQRQAKEEEKARRDAEKAAEEAALKAAQEKKLEEQRLKREEQRKKRDAEKKAQEEERARKEAEKQRRLKEERERQAEAERKQREQKEEKKRREDLKRKEKEEREAFERRTREERERKMREEQARKDRDAAREQEIRDRSGKREQVRTSPPHTLPGVIPYNLQSQAPPGFLQSPHYPMATPIVPKVSTPGRPRQQSHHGSSTSSPHSQPNSADSSHHPSISPRSMGHPQSGSTFGRQASIAPSSTFRSSVTSRAHQSFGIRWPRWSTVQPPPGIPGMAPRSTHPQESMYSSNAGMINPLRSFNGSGGIPAPPGMNGVRPMPPSRAFPADPVHGLPFAGNHGVPGAYPLQQASLSKAHSRQPSLSFDRSPLDSGTQPFPITRPSPIKRPSSSAQDRQNNGNVSVQREVDGLSAHLGSSALLDDTDATYPSNLSQSLPGAPAPGVFPGPTRASFQGPSLLTDPLGSPQTNFGIGSPMSNSTWSATPFGAASPFGTTWTPASAGTGWPPNNAFSAGGHHRPHTSRPVTIRLLVIQACKQLNSMTSPQKGPGSFHDVNLVLGQVEQLRNAGEPTISLDEMLDICDTEGSPQNGGGSFTIKEGPSGKSVRFEPDPNSAVSGHRGSIVPGDIGSPIPSNSHPAPFSGFGGPSSALRQYSSPPTGLFGGTPLS
ncbi:Stress response protein NST1 [Penicillium concentricum]|uniref:Stress response protein NST1 n=1 Tax=Penicillium concentricum TaxID=293559 RepID=A0A9W9VJ34_9EURO|nr:Stress response protein NST1 [Penicillium concentricum]KAJ5382689.1 Stress response protein NST1 [Penicillium concentricum]